ncbi:hypothetical protein ANTQUA_LOCUS5004 [Anthophora quadrimaculata]
MSKVHARDISVFFSAQLKIIDCGYVVEQSIHWQDIPAEAATRLEDLLEVAACLPSPCDLRERQVHSPRLFRVWFVRGTNETKSRQTHANHS